MKDNRKENLKDPFIKVEVQNDFIIERGGGGSGGTDAREIELRATQRWLQWRYIGDLEWKNLFDMYTLNTGGSGGGGGGGGTGEIPWDEIDEHIKDKVDERIDEIISIIEDGGIDSVELGQLRAIMASIDGDHPRILDLISLYQIDVVQPALSTTYNNAYQDLKTYIAPYVAGTVTVITDKNEFASKFTNYYTAKASIEMYAMDRLEEDLHQAKLTTELLNTITNFWNVQIFPDEGVIVAGTIAVGTKTVNNAGITGVTDQGQDSVRFWAGSNFANRYTAPFRVTNNGKFWLGNSNAGLDWNITTPNALTLRGSIIQDAGGNNFYPPVFRGDYSPSATYYFGNLVKYNSSLWMYKGAVAGNGGTPSESNANWELYITSGVGVFRSYVYKRSATAPATPTGGSFASPLPSPLDGWNDTPPTGVDQLYMTTRVFTQDGSPPQESAWKAPTPASDTDTLDIEWCPYDVPIADVGNPTSQPSFWSNNPDGAVYMALKYLVGGTWTAWQVVRIKGEDGTNGSNGNDGIDGKFMEVRYRVNTSWNTPPTAPSAWDRDPANWTTTIPIDYNPTLLQYLWKVTAYVNSGTNALETTWTAPIRETGVHGAQGADGTNGVDGATKFKSFVYLRSATAPSTPTGGSYASPIPSSGGWTDSVPSGTLPLWMSTRFFSSKVGESDAGWSTPRMPVDTELTDFEWSDSTNSNPGTPSAPLNGAVWKNDPQELSGDVQYMAIRYRASQTASWGAWVVSKVKGEKGADGVNGVSPPLVIDRGEYDPSATYVGSAQRVDVVLYGSLAYVTQSDAGTITGIAPTTTGKWNTFGAQFESVYTKVLNATTASINTLGVRRVNVLDDVNTVRTTIGVLPTSTQDPTSTSIFESSGVRTYHNSGRVSSYIGSVNNLPYTVQGSPRLANGWVIVTFEDVLGSPIRFVLDLSIQGFQYLTGAQYIPTYFSEHMTNINGFYNLISGSSVIKHVQEDFPEELSVFKDKLCYMYVNSGDPIRYVKVAGGGNTNANAVDDGFYITNMFTDLDVLSPNGGAKLYVNVIQLVNGIQVGSIAPLIYYISFINNTPNSSSVQIYMEDMDFNPISYFNVTKDSEPTFDMRYSILMGERV